MYTCKHDSLRQRQYYEASALRLDQMVCAGASYLALPKGTIQQTLVQSISPTLGPASGGTDIVLQVFICPLLM